MNRRTLIAAVGASPLTAQRALAQAKPAATPPELLDVFPSPQELGLDDKFLNPYRPDISSTSFADGLAVVYNGSYGTLLVFLFRHATDRSSVLQAWDDGQQWYNAMRESAVDMEVLAGRQQKLADRAAPDGVAEAIRIDGWDHWWSSEVGAGLYAIEPDLIAAMCIRGVFSAVLPGQSPAAAIDAVAEMIARSYQEKR